MIIENLKKIYKEISQIHHDLISTLDSIELEELPVNFTQEKPNKVAIDISIFEIITNIATSLYEKDTQISNFLKQASSHRKVSYEIKDFKRSLSFLRKSVIENSRFIAKTIKKVSLILHDYKERCRSGFIDFLKTLEIDLRRTLKPLVPTEVLQEQLNFKPICTDPELLSSLNSANNEQYSKISDNTIDKLNGHIQLLVNTLEEVAKNLIIITSNTYQSYYELVDPRLLYSEPPSPLAAPLPEYFSYDIANISEDGRRKNSVSLSEATKERILKKFIELQKHKTCITPTTSKKIQEKLESILKSNVKEPDLVQFFKEEGIPMSEREKLVYEIIHTERDTGRDVKYDEIVFGKNAKLTKETNEKRGREVKKIKVEQKDIRRFHTSPGSDTDINTYETVADERPRCIKKSEAVPKLNFKSSQEKIHEKKLPSGGKSRASTPGKSKKEKKPRRIRTPVFPKKIKKNK